MWIWTGSGKQAVGASRWKKDARSDQRDREVVGARHSGRSHQRLEMDPSYDRQDRRATASAAYSGKCPHGGPMAPPTALLPTREPQENRAPTSPTGSTVRPD